MSTKKWYKNKTTKNAAINRTQLANKHKIILSCPCLNAAETLDAQ